MRIRLGVRAGLLIALGGCGGADRAPSADANAAADTAAAVDTIPLAERRAAGGRIVFISERGGESPDVYAVSPAGGEPARLTDGPGADYPAAVTPDGAALLVVSVTEGEDHVERMSLLPLDGGGGAAPLGPVSARARSPSWGPAGEWLAFESDRESFRDVYRIARDGTGLKRLTENREGNFEPAVSPDGAWIAFASSRDGDAEVYVMRPDGGEERRLTAFHRDDWGPRWSPDGRTIAFLSNREGGDRVFLVAPDGTGLRRLSADSAASPDTAASASAQEADPAWSPDGRRIAITLRTRDGASRVRVVDVTTGEAREVAGTGGKDSHPAWSPDGRFLAFTSEKNGDADVWLARADGTGATRLTRSLGPDWLPRWAPR